MIKSDKINGHKYNINQIMHGQKMKGQLNPGVFFLLNRISDIIYQTSVVLLFFISVQYLLNPKGRLNTV